MRHLLMNPAFPDLVAAVADEEMAEKRPGWVSQSCRDGGESPMPEIVTDALRFLAQLW